MEQNEQLQMAIQVGQLLPETLHKVDYYKSIMLAESNLIKELEKEIGKKGTSSLQKARLKIELIKTNNSLYSKQGVFEEYMQRKQKYEHWLDEMSRETQINLPETIEKASKLTDNIRLISALEKWKEEKEPTLQSKIEFYLYLKQEIINNDKYGKKGKKKGKLSKVR